MGCFGCQKAKHSPTVIPHDSFVHWKATADWNWKPKDGQGCQRICISNEHTVLTIPELPTTDRVGLSLLFCHLRLPSDMNGSGTDMCRVYSTKAGAVVSRQNNTKTYITKEKLDCYAKNLQRQEHFSNPRGYIFDSIIANHFQLWSNTESQWVDLRLNRVMETFGYNEWTSNYFVITGTSDITK